MKAIFVSLFGLFYVTGSIVHIWTISIAYNEAGFLSALITSLLPVLGELYWMFKMFGENDTYAYLALTHVILAILYGLLGPKDR